MAMCRSGCPTPGLHGSWGECARAANLQVGPADVESMRQWDRNLAEYRKARAQGMQPRSVRRSAVEVAKKVYDA